MGHPVDPLDPKWHAESWFLHAARRAHQVNSRRVDSIDRRLALDETCTSPFGENNSSPSRNTVASPNDARNDLVDLFLDGRLDTEGALGVVSTSHREVPGPREVGLSLAARSNDKLGVVPSSAPESWNSKWPKHRVPGKRYVAVFHDEPTASVVPSVEFPSDEPSREEARATARSFKGKALGKEEESDVGENSEKEKADGLYKINPDVAEAVNEIRTLDRAAYFSSEHGGVSPFEAKGETRDEAFARFTSDKNYKTNQFSSPSKARLLINCAKTKTLFQLRKVKVALEKEAEGGTEGG